jgi:hypothetical protein
MHRATTSAYIWVTYRSWWIGLSVAVIAGNRLWSRWGAIPAVGLAWGLGVLVWTGTGGIAMVGGDDRAWCVPMGDRYAAVPLVLAPAALAVWAWKRSSAARC